MAHKFKETRSKAALHSAFSRARTKAPPTFSKAMTTIAPQTSSIDPVLMESVPRLRWDDAVHRFHYNMPIAQEPGENGFVLIHEFDNVSAFASMALPASELERLREMDRMNEIIHDVENAANLRAAVNAKQRRRAHSDEFHERTEPEPTKDKTKKRDVYHPGKHQSKHFHERHRAKPTRVGRVHQP